jgi:hypothetical protein
MGSACSDLRELLFQTDNSILVRAVILKGNRMKHDVQRRRSGQAVTEFVTMLGLLMLVLVMLALLLFTFREYGGRVMDLVGSEYP